MSAAAARDEQDRPLRDADEREPGDDERGGIDLAAERSRQAARDTRDAAAREHRDPPEPVHQPPGRQRRNAPAVRKIAGPSPRIPSTPVTRTSVTVPTATASCTIPDRRREGRREQDRVPADREGLHRRESILQRDDPSTRRRQRPCPGCLLPRDDAATRARAGVAGWVRNLRRRDASKPSSKASAKPSSGSSRSSARTARRARRLDRRGQRGAGGADVVRGGRASSARGCRPCRPAHPPVEEPVERAVRGSVVTAQALALPPHDRGHSRAHHRDPVPLAVARAARLASTGSPAAAPGRRSCNRRPRFAGA